MIRLSALDALESTWNDPKSVPFDSVARELLHRIRRAGPEERVELVIALSLYDPEAASEFAPVLIDAFERRQQRPWWTRDATIKSLSRIGPAARPALPMLVEVARGESGQDYVSELLMDCWQAIVAIDPGTAEARDVFDQMIERLEAGDSTVAWRLPEIVQQAGLDARPFWPRLWAVADSPNVARYVALKIREALAPFGLLAVAPAADSDATSLTD